MNLFKFEVVTPERVFYEGEAEMIIFKTSDGEIGIMANHEPMLIVNKFGILKIKKGTEIKYAFISEGIIEVTKEKVRAIVDVADWPEEIDIDENLKNKEILEERLKSEKVDLEMRAELIASIERAKSRIKTAQNVKF